ncbi:ATP-binding cassette domain-containing protein [Herpetosiphon giganteus]|uniref:ATP-binding cassette domain-containing protein n=1 Tax=Herpetosiphon giganteus TaxID=2029754 RepID=UPI0019599E47|nr:ATP-binding cassette domain-containing protein [Herpetosiphon giganteus]MBM7843369.1 signal transduction histidine kinase [Herpetosiphon giganteus]
MLTCRHVSKQFGTLPVIDEVSFDLAPGEVVGLTGQSGAGKSVLVRLLAGLEKPDTGVISTRGHLINSTQTAFRAGLAVIHQQPVLVDHLDVASAIFLGHEVGRNWLGWLSLPNQRQHTHMARQILAQLGMELPSLRTHVGNLSSEQRQMVAIAQVLIRKPQVVIIDEPTALLRYEYQQKLLELIREWQAQGVAVLFSSQNLDHLFAVSNRILVLRRGRFVFEAATEKTSREEVVRAQIGARDQQHLTPIIWALENYHRASQQAEALRQSQSSLEHDLASQNQLNRQLIGQLDQQVSNLDRANAALQEAQRRLLSEREGERKVLARELHDQVIQDLVSLNYDIDNLRSQIDDPEQASLGLDDLRDNIRQLVSTVRAICGNLRPPTIDSLGVNAAIQSFVRDWSSRSGIEVQLDLDDDLERLPEMLEISAFRMIQEGLSNVRKHAQASKVGISLRSTARRTLLLTIADNGRGLQAEINLAALANAGHYGLLGMSERVALVGGRFRVHNRAGGGLILEIEIPYQPL